MDEEHQQFELKYEEFILTICVKILDSRTIWEAGISNIGAHSEQNVA